MNNKRSKTTGATGAARSVTTKKEPRMVTVSMDEVIDAGLTKEQIERLERAELPGPSAKNGAIRTYEHPERPLYRALSKPVTIRLPLPDLRISRLLAAEADVPYQTYIKSVLHEALKERFLKSALSEAEPVLAGRGPEIAKRERMTAERKKRRSA